MRAVLIVLALLATSLAAPAVLAAPAMCVLSLSNLDVEVAFTGVSRTQACRAALATSGPNASIGYETPVGNVTCFVLYAPSSSPRTETEGAIVFDSGSGQGQILCEMYLSNPDLYVYNVDGTPYAGPDSQGAGAAV